MNPTLTDKSKLAATLRHAADLVEAGDSFEGNISYTCMDEKCREGDFLVAACFRTGNLQGQGGVWIIGEDIPETPAMRSLNPQR